ncbi:peptidase MA family metallohydrolase [Prosthecobacter dejongeii]|uniref:Tetratricopeptide (TPR) repeat protein n=1 Tax=Prosthecobacter dejongeii TaxID=48465 RepID=A0A7W8DRG8_9BACT|nr:peptidase MA family metallohydrolase [Prosthecobacter dejongeii]MBB5039468.1 tetratricopeptide (TPR) repeat protein [Prosthecobacter dejongeii]
MRCRILCLIAASCSLLLPSLAQELDLDRLFEDRNLAPVAQLLAKGDYELCGRICEAAIQRGMKAPEWRLMRIRALMRQGQEETARDEVELAVNTFPENLELLMLQHENAILLGRKDIANKALTAVNAAAKTKRPQDRTAQDWVSLGQAALALGADAKKVIEQYFTVAQKKEPKLEAAYLAEGHLALTKDDDARAADVFRAGLKAHGETALLRTGLALAFASSDREKQMENIARALELNPLQAEAHLAQAEMLIGAEKFMDAEAAIQKVLDVRENCPEAWALRAAVARLSAAGEGKVIAARQRGLQRWAQNPEVDHILGRVISRAYRFAEGQAHQRQALAFAPTFLPAKVQLCHDLLRLGEEDEAWKLAAEIRDHDGYNIQAHNIGLLEAQMKGYVTQSYDDFILKMPKRDWPIYGERALTLLRDAKSVLAAKYGLELKRPVMVEFFGAQQDFAIRTFGSLGGQGLLGVCFGTVITMNSPGGLAHGRNNWEATLWHEFCHVVTLTLTRNKMPRWLSEGISVHEETLKNPAWGMNMNAEFRQMILDEEAITPIGELTSAFLNAQDEDHLMFAYFQSSRVVAWLLERFGQDSIQRILKDLAEGKRINEALAAHTEELGKLEKEFEKYFKEQAQKQFGSLADWQKPKPEEVNLQDLDSLKIYRQSHPNHLLATQSYVQMMREQEKWEEVILAADQLIRLVPEDTSVKSGYQIKADALNKLGRKDEEIQILRYIAEHESSAMPVFLRLIEEDRSQKNWTSLRTQAQRAIALNPFLKTPQQALAEAAEAEGRTEEAIESYRRVLILAPETAAQTHFHLAQLHKSRDKFQAKKHLLDAISLAPRFREGHEMLRNWPP